MNKTLIYIALAACLAGFSSCRREPDTTPYGYIRIQPVIDRPDTRISGNQFETGDRIGVFVVTYSPDNQTPGTLGESDYASNAIYEYNAGSWTTPDGGLIPWPGTRRIDLYTYYPYDASLTDPRNYNFTITQDQSTQEGYNSSDLLWGRNIGSLPVSTLPLVFSHRLSKININIHSQIVPAEQLREFSDVFLEQIVTGCSFDLADGSATVAATAATEVIPLILGAAETGYDLSLTAVVPPQEITAGTRLIRINNRGINYHYTTEQAITFAQGYTTTFNIEITEQGIIVTTGSIAEWDDGGSVDGSTGARAPRVLDMTTPDWSKSYVYYIYDGNTLIGQVCREYLFRNQNPSIDQLGEVVYPLGDGAKMDLTKGYVARVYNRTRNSQTNRYEYNTGSVHGGRAVFGPKDTLYSYTAGSMPLVNRVRLEAADNITYADDNSIPTLTLVPYTVTDIDGNVYPVTKIGTQYWIRENFRAERFADGSPLTHYYYNDNKETFKYTMGALYTWYTVVDATGIAPEGWRVPSSDDWNSMWHYLNPDTGRKIKALEGWSGSTANADDASGFAGLPGGRRTDSGGYNELNSYGQWWGSNATSTSNGYRIYVGTGTSITESNLGKNYAESLRIMRDN